MEQSNSFIYSLYTMPLTWLFDLARDFIDRMITLQQLKVPPCLRSRDCVLVQTRLDVDLYGIGRVVTNERIKLSCDSVGC